MDITHFEGCRIISPTGATLTAAEAAELGLAVSEDVVYRHCNRQELHMDILYPAEIEADRKYPAVLYIHGGAWRHGTYKSGGGNNFAANGLVTFCVQYRFSQIAPYPAQLEDCLAALRWVKEHSAEYQVDTTRIGIQGGSSGGHLALMTAIMSQPDELAAVIACCSPTDLPALYLSTLASSWYFAERFAKMIVVEAESLGIKQPTALSIKDIEDFLNAPGFASAFDWLAGKELEGDPSPLECASPLHQLRDCKKKLPPVLLQHGLADPLVPVAQSLLMRDALKARGDDVELVIYPGARHNYECDNGVFQPERVAAMVRFFQKHIV